VTDAFRFINECSVQCTLRFLWKNLFHRKYSQNKMFVLIRQTAFNGIFINLLLLGCLGTVINIMQVTSGVNLYNMCTDSHKIKPWLGPNSFNTCNFKYNTH
jgi:hypothetical protein